MRLRAARGRTELVAVLACAVLACAALGACGGDDGGDAKCSVPGAGPGIDPTGAMCEHLTSYRLFADLATRTPADGVVPYSLATPLFSDYTTKDRFIFVPPGESLHWQDSDAFDAPTGTVLVKMFSYLEDRRAPDGDRRPLETRLLIKQDSGWTGASYVFAEGDPSEATLAIAGATVPAAWIHDDGSARTNDYVVPNKNQCKECHAEHADSVLDLLGPKARHLNHDAQLQALVTAGLVTGAPADAATWPHDVAAYDASSGTVEQRARTWLDINCAHCHNPRGAARTSGLFLTYDTTDALSLGLCKPPVAAGRGSGGRAYGIVPGQPDASIVMYRLESTEADVRMPELGRNLVDTEGAAIVRAWIAAMPGSCP